MVHKITLSKEGLLRLRGLVGCTNSDDWKLGGEVHRSGTVVFAGFSGAADGDGKFVGVLTFELKNVPLKGRRCSWKSLTEAPKPTRVAALRQYTRIR